MPWILASSGDRTKRNRWVESTPLPACTKTKDPSVSCINLEPGLPLYRRPQVPSLWNLPPPFSLRRKLGLNRVESPLYQLSLSSAQTWVRSPLILGAKGPWWVMPLLTSQEQFSHHLAGCGSGITEMSPGSLKPDHHLPSPTHSYYYEPGPIMAEVWNLKKVEIKRGGLSINTGFNLMPEILYFWHSPGDAGAVGVTSLPEGLAVVNTKWSLADISTSQASSQAGLLKQQP